VLPTSSNTTRSESTGSGRIANSTAKESNAVKIEKGTQSQRKEMDRRWSTGSTAKGSNAVNIEKDTKSQRKQMGGWSTAGISIVSILVFNTVFLLVLVKILYENNNGLLQIHDQIKLPVQEHEKSIEINADPKSVLKDEPFLSNAQMDNETLSDIANIVDGVEEENDSTVEEENDSRVEEEIDSTIEEPSSSISSPEVSHGSDRPDDAPDLNDMHNSDSEDGTTYEEEVNKENPSCEEEVVNKVEDQEIEKGVDVQPNTDKSNNVQSNTDKSSNVWVTVLGKKCRQLRTFFAHFFYRLLHFGRRPANGW